MNSKNILIVAATKFEIEPLLTKIGLSDTHIQPGYMYDGMCNGVRIDVLITGVGMVNTAYTMARYINSHYDFCINAGIAGSFNYDIKIGEVVNVVKDELCEMGAENDNDFIKWEDLALGGQSVFQCNNVTMLTTLNELKKVNGITVNTVHGNTSNIIKVKQLFNPDVESMEGAAFFRSCERKVDFPIQIRTISNYVEKRDKSKWNIPLAINNLNEAVIKIIEEINGN